MFQSISHSKWVQLTLKIFCTLGAVYTITTILMKEKQVASSLLVCMQDSTWHHHADTKSNKGFKKKKKHSLSPGGFACQNGTCNLTYTEH